MADQTTNSAPASSGPDGDDAYEGEDVREGVDFVQDDAGANLRLIDGDSAHPADSVHDYAQRVRPD